MEESREPRDSRESRDSRNSRDSRDNRDNRDSSDRRRMSYKEKREFEQLEKDIAALEAEKKQIEDALSSGTISVEKITELSKRLPVLNDELDEKSMRWLELSEMI